MTVVSDGSGRIKVVLTYEDVAELGISVSELNCSDPDTRLMLRALFKTATEKIGCDCGSDRLLIEAYPHIGGGGVLYFTPLLPPKSRKFRLKSSKCGDYIYEFSDGAGLLDCISVLYGNESTRALESRVYYMENRFYLIVETDGTDSYALWQAKEFSDGFKTDTIFKRLSQEQATILTGSNAIIEIGEKLPKGYIS